MRWGRSGARADNGARSVVFPHPPGGGGPGSFQLRFEKALRERGWRVGYLDEEHGRPSVLFIVGGTKRVWTVFRWRVRGVPVVYRLDGIPWLHRKRWPGVKLFAKAEVATLLLKITQAFLADELVYQSRFVEEWWARRGWRTRSQGSIIHNGVDLNRFAPAEGPAPARPDLISVEGNIDYTPYAIGLLNELAEGLQPSGIRIRLYGGFNNASSEHRLSPLIDYRGPVARDRVHSVFRDAIYLSLDVNAACPNTVVEAMSSGLPVVGLRTGALPELVPPGCGEVVDYGGDPWALDPPKVGPLCEAVLKVADDYAAYATRARRHAEEVFDMDRVAGRYIEILERAMALSDVPGSTRAQPVQPDPT